MNNLLLLTDSYKYTHHKMYPPGTTNIYSYFESRGGKFPSVVFFGLQYILKEYFSRPINLHDIWEAEDICERHIGSGVFNGRGWRNLFRKYDGKLPVRIEAVPEGCVVPVSNVLMTVENTDPEFPWLTNFIESILVQVWYPSTVATTSYYAKKLISEFLDETGDPGLVDFKLHDFGFRGVSSVESAGLGGAAHLLSFSGSDTVPALKVIKDYYNEPDKMFGFSIPASEHSTITSWGKEHEVDAYRNILEQYPSGLVACVSDSYNIHSAIDVLFGQLLHSEINNREGTFIVRPDSGDPERVVLDCIERLGTAFGFTLNDKGYKVLNPKVRLIQGDGVNYDSIKRILLGLKNHCWSADNIAFGMGGGLLQDVNRDTQKFAFKCSSAVVNGEERAVFKDPITDSGKRSKKGRLGLYYGLDGQFFTDGIPPKKAALGNSLTTVFENGKLLIDDRFSDIKLRLGLF